MVNSTPAERFGDWDQYEKLRSDLYGMCARVLAFPQKNEHERHFLLAAIRRTLSLEKAFVQSVESNNGQMAMTLVRLNLDTLARFYTLYWAEQTEGMSAESLAKDIAQGKSIKNMKFKKSKENATDRWLIEQIKPLGKWIPIVYTKTSGAIHFSDFHISQLIQQFKAAERLEDGSVLGEISIGPGERDSDPELYREVRQAFLHISMMLAEGIRHRCELACC